MKVQFENVSKSFDGKKVLDNLSAEFPQSGIVCISGPSGCGKTTILRLIAGLEKPDNGTVTVNGKISFHFQEDRLLLWLTATENVSVVSNIETANKMLKLMQLEEDKEKYPNELSGGMCRRVSLARAIAFDADILLLDEPFKGLDDELKAEIMKTIKEIGKEKLIVMVTHDKDEIDKLADKEIKIGASQK